MIKYLMYIKATSSINKGDHNVILEGEYTRLIKNSVFADDEIKKIAKPTSLPNEFQSIHDPLTRNIHGSSPDGYGTMELYYLDFNES